MNLVQVDWIEGDCCSLAEACTLLTVTLVLSEKKLVRLLHVFVPCWCRYCHIHFSQCVLLRLLWHTIVEWLKKASLLWTLIFNHPCYAAFLAYVHITKCNNPLLLPSFIVLWWGHDITWPRIEITEEQMFTVQCVDSGYRVRLYTSHEQWVTAALVRSWGEKTFWVCGLGRFWWRD